MTFFTKSITKLISFSFLVIAFSNGTIMAQTTSGGLATVEPVMGRTATAASGGLATVEPILGRMASTISSTKVVESDEIRISPNPTYGTMYIQHPQFTGTLVLYNLNGQIVAQAQSLNATNTSIDLSLLPQGMYLLEINGKDMKKIVKY
jgi:hypothetical protein